MRIDLFAVWFMSGLMSSQLDKTAVFKVSLPAGGLQPSSIPPVAQLATLPFPSSPLGATHLNDVSDAILS